VGKVHCSRHGRDESGLLACKHIAAAVYSNQQIPHMTCVTTEIYGFNISTTLCDDCRQAYR